MQLTKTTATLLTALTLLASALPTDLTNAKHYQVTTLPGLDVIPTSLVPEMYAGHLPISDEDSDEESQLFFWKFLKPSGDSKQLIIWLNGGPGCSSMDGALMESGPFRVTSDLKLSYNNGSFHEAADIVYVDQPRGTGFSYTDGDKYDIDLEEMAKHFVGFLKNYYKVFPDDATRELYIAGESYAGQYIPFIAKAILESHEMKDLNVNLKGLVIGNGWIDPVSQSLSYIPYLLESKIISQSDSFWPSLLHDQELCQNAINAGAGKDSFTISVCENILNRILSYTKDQSLPEDQQCLNMYDTQLRDSYPSCGMNWPPDLKNVYPYLADKEFVKAVNLNPSRIQKWRECDANVAKKLKNKGSKPSIHILPDLLSQLEIVLFGGDRDIICNNHGVLDLIENLEWEGSKGFSDLKQAYNWNFNGIQVGDVQTERNLTFVSVYNSSHMVPFDKPSEARGVFDIMIGNFELKSRDDGTEYLETPIYGKGKETTNPSSDSDSSPPSDTRTKSSLPFLFYLLAVISFGALAYYYNKDKTTIGTKPILRSQSRGGRTSSHRKKKSVSWADVEGQEDNSADQDLELGEVRKSGKFGGFFNNGASPQGKYMRAPSQGDGDIEENDLEMDLSLTSGDDVVAQYEDIELSDNVGSIVDKKKEIDDDDDDDDDEFNFDIELEGNPTTSKNT